MKFCIPVIQPNQDKLNQLNMLHDNFKNRTDDFIDLIASFVKDNRSNKLLTKKPYIRNLLSNAGQIAYSYGEIKKVKPDIEKSLFKETLKAKLERYRKENITTASVLAFFFNAKSFLELVKKYTKIRETDYKDLLDNITFIRDHLAHSYQKDKDVKYLSTSGVFVTYAMQLGFSLETLRLDDIETGEEVGQINFSLDAFYFSIRDIFKKLKDSTSLFK